MNKEKLLEHLTGQYEYCRDTAKTSECAVWKNDEIALKQAIEMCKMLYFLLENFGGKGELDEYKTILLDGGFDNDIVNTLYNETERW